MKRHHRVRAALTAVLPVLLIACAPHPERVAAALPPAPVATADAAKRLDALVDEYWERYLRLNPLSATVNGDYRYDDRFENVSSEEYIRASRDLDREYLDRILALDASGLTGQSLLTYEVFLRDRRVALEGYGFPSELLPVDQFYSPVHLFAQMGSGKGFHPFATVKDYEDWLLRVKGFVVWSDTAIRRMREGMARGVVQPKVLIERTVPQIEALIAPDPRRSVFFGPVEVIPAGFGAADRERLRAAFERTIVTDINPALRRMADFLAHEYLRGCRDSIGISALPDGRRWYQYLIRARTTTDLTPEQIHQIGLDEVERISAEMDAIIRQVGFQGDRQAFMAKLRTDPRFHYTTAEDLLNGYRALKQRVRAGMPRLFAIAPRADFEIRAVESFRERSAANASYEQPAPDGRRPGVFYANTYDLASRPSYMQETTFLHEALPGHHFQIALQQEAGDLPRFRRFGGYTAYVEGWGLYAETLGGELGLFTDPYSRFGALGAESWRAARLVVDTGIHAMGWSREQAIEYLNAHAPLGPADAVAEVERYIAYVGQALTYKLGQLEFTALRTRAQRRLGERFDVRALHTEFLKDGPLPLDVLDAKVQRWIDAQATAPASR